jgi:hypothetical protein
LRGAREQKMTGEVLRSYVKFLLRVMVLIDV